MDIVISHYKEDLNWINNIEHNIIIYSKGGEKKYIPLLNIGRESHTYCHHIIYNWNYLSEYTVFCQGNPFEHCKDFINMINVPHETLLADSIYYSDEIGCPQHCGLDIDKYKNLFIQDETYPIMFGAGAQFKIHKDTIYRLGWKFWNELLKYHYVDDSFPWIIERLWKKILLI